MDKTKYTLLANERVKIELAAEDLAEISTWSPAEWKRVFEEIRKAPVYVPGGVGVSAPAGVDVVVGRANLKIRKYLRRKKAA
jgi:hypothetical protein